MVALILSSAEHEEPVSSLTAKTAPHRVSQPTGLPSWVIAVAPEFSQNWEKTRRPSPHAAHSLDDEPLSDQGPGYKTQRPSSGIILLLAKVVVVDKDDNEPLPSRLHKTLAKKPKIQPPTPAQQDVLNWLTLRLKSKGRNCQYCFKMADLIQYRNEKVGNL